MNMKRYIIPVAAVLLATLASCGNGAVRQPKAAGTPELSAAPVLQLVEVQAAAKENVPYTMVFSSTVQANIVNNIAPQTAGRIVRINAEIGDFVNAGQVLAEMERANLIQAELRLKNAKAELDRVKSLLDEGAISQSDYDQLELNYKVSKSSYDNLRDNTILRSPVTGVVTARNYDKGDMYSMAQPLFTVQQIVPVKLLVPISESDYTRVRKGDKVTVQADALPGRSYEGKIVRIHPTMDAATHTFNVEVQVRNEKKELRPGMFARATVDFGSANSITVPDQAVVKMQGAGTRSVYVMEADSTVSARVVTLGRHFDSKYEILEGLAEGESVVVKGASTLKSGEKVRLQ